MGFKLFCSTVLPQKYSLKLYLLPGKIPMYKLEAMQISGKNQIGKVGQLINKKQARMLEIRRRLE
jgi:hypothetical protein